MDEKKQKLERRIADLIMAVADDLKDYADDIASGAMALPLQEFTIEIDIGMHGGLMDAAPKITVTSGHVSMKALDVIVNKQ